MRYEYKVDTQIYVSEKHNCIFINKNPGQDVISCLSTVLCTLSTPRFIINESNTWMAGNEVDDQSPYTLNIEYQIF